MFTTKVFKKIVKAIANNDSIRESLRHLKFEYTNAKNEMTLDEVWKTIKEGNFKYPIKWEK